MSAEAGLKQIRELLGPSGVIDKPAEMQTYLVSWRNGWEGKTPFIARPTDTKQLSEIITICAREKISVVPQGGNTGLVGGAIPSAKGDQLVVSLSRMNKIRALDPVGAVATVEAGVILQTLQEEADKAGFLFPLSMASQGSAQIGGAISTNAGGTAVLRYGNMREQVLGLEVVLPSGEILSNLKSLPKDNTGYNLNHVFIGAEGTLGIVTAATLRLFPRLNQSVTAIAAAGDVEAVLDLFHRFRSEAGEYLIAFEIISQAAMGLVVKNVPGMRFPGKDDAPYYVLIELASASSSIPLRDMFEAIVGAAMEKEKIIDAVIAENTAQSKQLWSLRENASEALRKEGQGVHFDISLPRAEIAAFFKKTDALVKQVVPEIIIAPFGHIGDGNLHYNMCFAE